MSSDEPVEDTGEETNKRIGVVKWFNVVRGYGFIKPDDGGQEVFVHQSVLQMPGFRSLGSDEEVEFECKSSDKGVEAVKVYGRGGAPLSGSERRPLSKRKIRKIRCYNCGEFTTHIASKCPKPPMPKRCHHCKSEGHLVADCPQKQQTDTPSSDSDNSGSDNRQEQSEGAYGVTRAHTDT